MSSTWPGREALRNLRGLRHVRGSSEAGVVMVMKQNVLMFFMREGRMEEVTKLSEMHIRFSLVY